MKLCTHKRLYKFFVAVPFSSFFRPTLLPPLRSLSSSPLRTKFLTTLCIRSLLTFVMPKNVLAHTLIKWPSLKCTWYFIDSEAWLNFPRFGFCFCNKPIWEGLVQFYLITNKSAWKSLICFIVSVVQLYGNPGCPLWPQVGKASSAFCLYL